MLQIKPLSLKKKCDQQHLASDACKTRASDSPMWILAARITYDQHQFPLVLVLVPLENV